VIVLEGEQLDHRGMVVDFSDIKKHVAGWIDAHLDHRMILHEADPIVPILRDMGEPMYLVSENPTAESIAKLIYDFAKSHRLPVKEVSLWETFNSYATYREE
jgi:6-pyruvoyltetrahydropterin/6-carboxytetrahydropterin synthase